MKRQFRKQTVFNLMPTVQMLRSKLNSPETIFSSDLALIFANFLVYIRFEQT